MISREKMLQMQKEISGKLTAAIAMLLVSSILLCLTSYAWFILSTAPEVSSMKTTAGANGALEIALQSTIREDGKAAVQNTNITGGVGTSSSLSTVSVNEANTHWGNIIDLSSGYGLEHITLYPSRLKVTPTTVDGKTSYAVDTAHILQVPQFGADGRLTALSDATKTYYNGTNFSAGNNWGVNVLGAVNENVGEEDTITLTYARDIVLQEAREKVAAYRTELREKMTQTIEKNSMGIMGLFIAYSQNEDLPAPPNEYEASVVSYVSTMGTVVSDAADALRWALLANAAADENTYQSGKEEDMKALGDLYASVMQLPLTGDQSVYSVALDNGYTELAEAAQSMATAVGRVSVAEEYVRQGHVGNAGLQLISFDQLFMYGNAKNGNVQDAISAIKYDFAIDDNRKTEENYKGLATEDTIFTVSHTDPTQTNLFSAIASVIGDYTGDMNIWLEVELEEFINEDGDPDARFVPSWTDEEPTGENVVSKTKLTYSIKATCGNTFRDWADVDSIRDADGKFISSPRMGVLGSVSKQIAGIEAPGVVRVVITRSDVAAYGYSADLAFRASESTNLLLQQTGIARVADAAGQEGTSATQGAGSTVQFTVSGDMTTEQVESLLQGIYIVFMNTSTGAIYKVAALDPASITVNWAAIPATATATFALYEPAFSADGTLTLGEKVSDNVITALSADETYFISAVVYLSGDQVDSTMFSATQGLSLDGTINLQFASSETLTPMQYDFTAGEADIKKIRFQNIVWKREDALRRVPNKRDGLAASVRRAM